ncbi:hypothetical protein BTVI_132015 [Pitangus sulphuratus]|nr:hypothetical protein BTVI_132015 [Pitangus sulphuratus]
METGLVWLGRCIFPLNSVGTWVLQGSHSQSMELGDLGRLDYFTIPGLAKETINEPEGKEEKKQEAVGDE